MGKIGTGRDTDTAGKDGANTMLEICEYMLNNSFRRGQDSEVVGACRDAVVDALNAYDDAQTRLISAETRLCNAMTPLLAALCLPDVTAEPDLCQDDPDLSQDDPGTDSE